MTPNEISIARYRRVAAGYDASAEFTMPLRLRTIALLSLQPGDVVLTGTPAGVGPLQAGDELLLSLAGHDFAARIAS